jgi:hypothetical protein
VTAEEVLAADAGVERVYESMGFTPMFLSKNSIVFGRCLRQFLSMCDISK